MGLRYVFAAAMAIALGAPAAASAGGDAELSGRLEQLEQRVGQLEVDREIGADADVQMEERVTRLVNVSGYLDTEYVFGDEAETDDRFRIHHFSVFMEKQVSDRWKIFTEMEYEDAPYFEATSSGDLVAAEGKILLEQVYSDYRASDALTVRTGRYLTPAGIWLIHHYPPFVPTQQRPLHIRQVFPQYMDGLSLFGGVAAGEGVVDYHLYAGNGQGNDGHGDDNGSKAVGGRLSLFLPQMAELKVGVSALSDRLGDDTVKSSAGADLSLRAGPVRFQAEYATADFGPAEGAHWRMAGYYLQGQYDRGRFTLFYRYDYFDPSDAAEADDTVVHSAGFNYHWTPVVVSKLEANRFDLADGADREDYLQWIVSTAIFF